MKLVIGGATGFVGTNLLRQALLSKDVSSIIAVGRRPASAPEGTDASKLDNIVSKDLLQYSEEAKQKLAGVDACIWTIAVTPNKQKGMEWEEIKKASSDYAMVALKTLLEIRGSSASGKKPLRFVYFSGVAAERDQTKKPMLFPQYSLMRGEAETMLLQHAADSKGAAEVCCLKPGLIMGPNFWGRGLVNSASSMVGAPAVKVEECSAASLKQVLLGIEMETLENDDIKNIGAAYLKRE